MCIYVAEDVKATPVDIAALKERDIEQVWCVVHHGSDAVLVGCIYRPPNSSLENHLHTTDRIISTLKHAKRAVKTLGCSTMFVYGDYNLPHVRYEAVDVDGGTAILPYISTESAGCRASDERFSDALGDLDLQQLVTFPTYHDSYKATATHTLDLVITDDPCRAFDIESDAPLGATPMGRAHVVVKWSIAMARDARRMSTRPRYLWSKADWGSVQRAMKDYAW